MNYRRYSFRAVIVLHNVTGRELRTLKQYCMSLYTKQHELRRSNKYWTKASVTHLNPDDMSRLTSVLIFEIENANSVKALKAIEGNLREEAKTTFRGCITDITCTHKSQ